MGFSKERYDNHFNEERMKLNDFILISRYKYILFQCKYLGRDTETLINYMFELEYRDIPYRR